MPLALSLVPIDRQFDGCRSVMFVACNVCPRMHVAWEHHEPLCSVAMLLGRKDSFDRYLTGLRLDAHRRGQRSAVFPTSRASAACLWSTALARKFRRAGADFEAIGVVGCESAVRTVSQVFPGKRIVQLVSVEGIANFTLRTAWPLTVDITAAAQIPREGIHAAGSIATDPKPTTDAQLAATGIVAKAAVGAALGVDEDRATTWGSGHSVASAGDASGCAPGTREGAGLDASVCGTENH